MPQLAGKKGSVPLAMFEIVHVFIPFDRQQGFFLGIAFLAAGNKIVLGGASTAGQGDHMIHGQAGKTHLLPAVPTMLSMAK